MELLHYRQRLSGGVGDHVRVRKAVLSEVPVEDLDLQLERRRIRRTPDDCLLVADARLSQPCIANPGQMIAAEHVPELVLVAELLIPVGVKKEMLRARARPPRLLEVVIQVAVDADEG